MQIDKYDTAQVVNLIQKAKKIAVIPSKIAGADAFCAAAGLFHLLQDKGKEVIFVHQGKVPEVCGGLIDAREIAKNVNQRELLVLINYEGTPASKASYSVEDGTLQIRIRPVPKDFRKSNVMAKITGFDFDLVFVVGAQEIEDLGQTYEELEDELKGAEVVNIDNTALNKRFGVVNIIDPSEETLSLLLFKQATGWGYNPNKRAAKAFLIGIALRDGIDAPVNS